MTYLASMKRLTWTQTIASAILGAVLGSFLTVLLLVRHYPTPTTNSLNVASTIATLAGVLVAAIGVLFASYTIWVNRQSQVKAEITKDLTATVEQIVLDSAKSTYLADRAWDDNLPASIRLEFVDQAEANSQFNRYSLSELRCAVLLDAIASSMLTNDINAAYLDEVLLRANDLLRDFPRDVDILRYKATCEGFLGRRSALKTIETAIGIYPDVSAQWVSAYPPLHWAMLTLADRANVIDRAEITRLLGYPILTDHPHWQGFLEDASSHTAPYGVGFYYALTYENAYERIRLLRDNERSRTIVVWSSDSTKSETYVSIDTLCNTLSARYKIALHVEPQYYRE